MVGFIIYFIRVKINIFFFCFNLMFFQIKSSLSIFAVMTPVKIWKWCIILSCFLVSNERLNIILFFTSAQYLLFFMYKVCLLDKSSVSYNLIATRLAHIQLFLYLWSIAKTSKLMLLSFRSKHYLKFLLFIYLLTFQAIFFQH